MISAPTSTGEAAAAAPRILIGIDAGTTSIKSVAFANDGRVLASARRDVDVLHSAAAAAEADMEQIWRLSFETLAEVVAAVRAAHPARSIIGIGVTGQGDGAWLLDETSRPIGPAVLWNDGRSANTVEAWEGSARDIAIRAATGTPLTPGSLPAIWQRLSAGDAEAGTPAPGAPSAARHLNCKDWIRFRLTGIAATDPSEASRTYLDTATGAYSAELLAALGHEAVGPILPDVLDSEAVTGTLLPEVQQRLGIDVDVPVAVGAVDTAVAGVGLGAVADHDSYVILGTTAAVCAQQPDRASRRHPDSIILRTGRGDQVTEVLGQMSGMPNLDWARRTLGYGDRSWDDLERIAAASAEEARGIVYLPYSAPSGERAPFRDSHASAGWVGAHVTTSPAAMLFAVYRGIAHSVHESLLALGIDEAGTAATITVGGGGAHSALLCRLLADLSGRTVVRQLDGEVGARGAAILAYAAVSPTVDLAEAVAALQPPVEEIAPSPANRAESLRSFEAFTSVRDALRPHWRLLTDPPG